MNIKNTLIAAISLAGFSNFINASEKSPDLVLLERLLKNEERLPGLQNLGKVQWKRMAEIMNKEPEAVLIVHQLVGIRTDKLVRSHIMDSANAQKKIQEDAQEEKRENKENYILATGDARARKKVIEQRKKREK